MKTKGERMNWGRPRLFLCQAEVEGEKKCDKQCDHCNKYYKTLENKFKI